MKKIDLNPVPRVNKPKFPISLEYHGWDITIDLYFNMYHFFGSKQWDENNVRAITRSYKEDTDLRKCLTTFKSVLDSDKTKVDL